MLKSSTLRRIEVTSLSVAGAIAVVAVAFYWTREWISFGVGALPWVVAPLLPYVILTLATYFLNRSAEIRARLLCTCTGSVVLLVLTAVLYLPFLDGSLVFYLRWSLGLSIPLLGGAALFFAVITWFVGRSKARAQPAL